MKKLSKVFWTKGLVRLGIIATPHFLQQVPLPLSLWPGVILTGVKKEKLVVSMK